MKDNGTIKIDKEEDFTMCKNDIIRHVGEGGMSAKALGVYIVIKYYINIPNFILHKDHIQRVSGEGKKAFETVWKELKELGYIIQERKKTKDGKWKYEYTLMSSKENVDKNKKAPTDQRGTKENINVNDSICNNNNINTLKEENKVENNVSEVEKVIKDSCVNIKEKDMKECIETFTDIDRLKKALSILEAKNSHGIKALRLAYRDIDKVSDGNSNKRVFVAGGNAYSNYSEEELLRMNQRKHQQKIIEHKFV